MPGLFGYWRKDKKNGDSICLDAMAQSMQVHSGLRVEVNNYSKFSAGRVHLGYFQPDAQPVTDQDERYLLWMDGEFNNVSDLRRTFNCNESATDGDTALALTLFLKMGWDFLLQVDGLFTIALYDQYTHQLTLVNDRYGLHPLYYVQTVHGVGYAGEVKALLRLPGVETCIDPKAVNEWFNYGFLLGDRTWIKGIKLLPSATIMTIVRSGVKYQKYWSWHDIQPLSESVSEVKIIEELCHLWEQAVSRRVDDQRVGQLLSGGLDSRAILAALPTNINFPYHTVTFGRCGCKDVEIARQVAGLKGVEHHFIEINEDNWLLSRIDAIWHTDGMGRILDLHGAESIPLMRKYSDVHLSGFAGDLIAGGSYLVTKDIDLYLKKKLLLKNRCGFEMAHALFYPKMLYSRNSFPRDLFMVDQRVRRLTNTGIIMMSSFLEARMPFFDKDFLMFVLALPEKMRMHSNIYKKMLLTKYPEFYQNISWQNTGLPISASWWQQRMQQTGQFFKKAISYSGRKAGINLTFGDKSFVNYSRWLRMDPSSNFIQQLLLGNDALYTQYIDQDIARNMVINFIKNQDNNCIVSIGLLLTFEIYLHQLANDDRIETLIASSPVNSIN